MPGIGPAGEDTKNVDEFIVDDCIGLLKFAKSELFVATDVALFFGEVLITVAAGRPATSLLPPPPPPQPPKVITAANISERPQYRFRNLIY